MANLEVLLGKEVIGKNGKIVPTINLVEKQVLGLYFSAHWCPPCRNFTPVLTECYKKVVGADKKLEIVFVSFDRGQNEFNEYFDSMPWLALPLNSDLKDLLSDKYDVSGIPALILIDPATGKEISRDGREIVEKDRNGDHFPWNGY